MKNNTFRTLLIVCASLLLGYYVGVNKVTFDWKNYKPEIHVISKEPPARLKSVDFSLFWNVWDKVEQSYYDKKAVDPQKFLNGAISGLVNSLGDPYTVYLPPVQNSEFKQGMAGQFEGIGAQLDMKGNQIIVVAPLDGSPAQKKGIKAGDAIIKVDDQLTTGWNLNQAVEKIRGPKGSQVVLTIVHKSESDQKKIVITRDTISIKSVDGWIKQIKEIENVNIKGKEDEKVMYIRLSQFGDNTNREWLSLVNSLTLEKNKQKNIKGVVLDLRNNPGGYLQDATFIASEFIKDGNVVIQEKGDGEKETFSVARKGLLTDLPVVVLINKGSASASEIVAGAIRDHKRGKLVGETSFGKGTIQQAEDLGEGAGIHITVAKWLTPNETWVHGKGLEPDVKAEVDTKDQTHDAQLEKAIMELVK